MSLFERWFPRADAPRAAEYRSEARTHVGRVRRINEDRVFNRPERRLWAVADGMGGHDGGDIAATLTIDTLEAVAGRAGTLSPAQVAAGLERAHRAILARNAREGGSSGTTIVALLADDLSGDLFWAGDSRAYRIRAGHAQRLTRDHSVVQELIDAGALAPERAETHPRAHVVTRALGIGARVLIEHCRIDILPGDALLLCSDGFSRSLSDAAIAEICARDADDPDRMIRDAVERDGRDNISFVLIRRPD